MHKSALTVAAATAFLILSGSCSKPVPKSSVPLPPPPSSESQLIVNFFAAEPSTVIQGQSSVLRWSVSNADSVQIDNGVGPVGPSDRREVHPTVTTIYKLQAARGSETTSAVFTVTVTGAPPPPPGDKSGQGTSAHLSADSLASELRDIHFAYGEDAVIQADRPVLEKDASVLKDALLRDSKLVMTIEGHCDERGSAEYNMGLGDRRANIIKTSLVSLGVPEAQLNPVSFGKERPVCIETTESCFARNRRAHFSPSQ